MRGHLTVKFLQNYNLATMVENAGAIKDFPFASKIILALQLRYHQCVPKISTLILASRTHSPYEKFPFKFSFTTSYNIDYYIIYKEGLCGNDDFLSNTIYKLKIKKYNIKKMNDKKNFDLQYRCSKMNLQLNSCYFGTDCIWFYKMIFQYSV